MVKHVSSFFFFFKKKKIVQELQKNQFFFFEKGLFKKSKYDDRTLDKNPITENQRRNSWRDLLDKWFLLQKNKLDLVRKNTIEKKKQSEKETKQKKG